MSRPRVAFDVDGVLYDFEGTARFMLEERTGVQLEVSTAWNSVPEQMAARGLGEHWQWLWQEGGGIEAGLFRHGHVLRGSLAAVRRIAKVAEVLAITSRPKRAAADTLAWLGFHGFPFGEVHILDGTPKSSILPWADLYVDDREENCRELARGTLGDVLLWKQPWNDLSRTMQGLEMGPRERLSVADSWSVVEAKVKVLCGDA